jgi:hypothetical protein
MHQRCLAEGKQASMDMTAPKVRCNEKNDATEPLLGLSLEKRYTEKLLGMLLMVWH